MPLAWPDFRLDKPLWQIYDFATYVAEGFNANTLIYSAILYKARALSGIPLRAYTGDPDSPEPLPADAPLSQLCARPNPHMAWRFFQMLRVTYLNLTGNSFTLCDRPRGGGLPGALWALRPDRTFIVPRKEKKGLLGYIYTPEGAQVWNGLSSMERRQALESGDALPILPQDMMHTKLPNPGDELEGLGYGLSPISPLAYSADVDNMVTKFLKLFFQKGALPAGVLKFADSLDDDTVGRIRERWGELYGGYENWSEIAVLDQAGEYERIGFTFEELGFDGIDERNESRILGPFGVPPILIGTRVGLNRSTYANYQEARRACWEDTLIPEKDLFESEDGYYLQDRDGKDFVRYDLAKVPALQQDKVAQVGAAYQMWQMGTPADLAYQTVGLTVEQFPGSEQAFLPLSVQTVEVALEPPPEPGPTPPQLLPFTGQSGAPKEPEPEPTPAAEQDNAGAAEAEDENEEAQKKRPFRRKYSEDQPRDEGGRFGEGSGSGGETGGGGNRAAQYLLGMEGATAEEYAAAYQAYQAGDANIIKEAEGRLATAAGVDPDDVAYATRSWTRSSSDDPQSIELQMAAGQAFGLPVPTYLDERLGTSIREYEAEEGELPDLLDRGESAGILTSMYGLTQEDLGAAGFGPNDTIRLYRGIGERSATGMESGDDVDLDLNPLSSWSLSPATAAYAASVRGVGKVIVADVPVRDILSTARTGLGTLWEAEVVVIGRKGLRGKVQ